MNATPLLYVGKRYPNLMPCFGVQICAPCQMASTLIRGKSSPMSTMGHPWTVHVPRTPMKKARGQSRAFIYENDRWYYGCSSWYMNGVQLWQEASVDIIAQLGYWVTWRLFLYVKSSGTRMEVTIILLLFAENESEKILIDLYSHTAFFSVEAFLFKF